MTTQRKKKPENTARPSPFNSFKGFANIELPSVAKDQIIEESKKHEILDETIFNLLESGYKLSFSKKVGEDTITITATGVEGSDASEGFAVSAWSESPTRGALALAYKIHEVADGDISSFCKSKRSTSEV